MLIGCLTLGMEPALMRAIIEQESSGDPVALNVNRWEGKPFRPTSAEEAVEAAHHFVDAGYTVDVGLAGIDSENLERLGIGFETALEPCTNVSLGETIFMEGLARAYADGHAGDAALRTSLSLYNTGSMTRGFENGYVEAVWSRYAASDAYLGRTRSTRIEWTPAAGRRRRGARRRSGCARHAALLARSLDRRAPMDAAPVTDRRRPTGCPGVGARKHRAGRRHRRVAIGHAGPGGRPVNAPTNTRTSPPVARVTRQLDQAPVSEYDGRVVDKLRRELEFLLAFLDEEDVQEIFVNPDGAVFVDRAGQDRVLEGYVAAPRSPASWPRSRAA